MPKFKYVPKKDNLPLESSDNKEVSQEIKTEETKTQTEIKSSVTPTPYRMNPIVQPKPFPKKEDEIKVEQPQAEQLKPIEQPIKTIKKEQEETTVNIDIPEFVKPVEEKPLVTVQEETERDNFDLDFLIDKAESNKKEKKIVKKPEINFTKYKPSKKIILLVGVVILAIIMVIGVCNLSAGPDYTITTQDVIATSVHNIEEGA